MKKINFTIGFKRVGDFSSYVIVPDNFTEQDIENRIKRASTFHIEWEEDKDYIEFPDRLRKDFFERYNREPTEDELLDIMEVLIEERIKRSKGG